MEEWTNPSILCVQYLTNMLNLGRVRGIYGRGRKLQTNPELFLINLCAIVVWAKWFWNYFKCIIDLSKEESVFMVLGDRVLTMEERTYKYEIGADNNDSYGDILKLKVLLWMHNL